MRREAQDFTPGVHAAGEAASYIKRPTSPRHFLPQELTLTWDPLRQVVVEARVLPRLGWGQSRVGYQLSQALVLKLTDDASLNGPEIDMARRFPRLMAPILTSGSMWIGLGPEGVPGAGLHRFLYHVQEHRCQARDWLQENAANGLRVHSYLLATLATLLHLYVCGVDAKDVGISNLSHRPLGTRMVPLPAFIDANNWGPSHGRPEWTGFWRVVAKYCPHDVGYFRQVSRGPPQACFDQICSTPGTLGGRSSLAVHHPGLGGCGNRAASLGASSFPAFGLRSQLFLLSSCNIVPCRWPVGAPRSRLLSCGFAVAG